MAVQLINTGANPNDNSGDTLQLAFNKCNHNFGELYASLGNSVVPSPTLSDAGKLLIVKSDGTGYQLSPGTFGNAKITVSATPPNSPATGNLWFDDLGGRLYIYYGDNDSNQWIETSPPLLNFKLVPPAHAVGAPGDAAGEWSADYNYYYYCTATYTGNSDPIWRRIAFGTNNSW
jgi:hypothetical protein